MTARVLVVCGLVACVCLVLDPPLQSNIFRMVNRCIVLIFLTQFILCIISTALFGSWSKSSEGTRLWYLGEILLVRCSQGVVPQRVSV